MRKSYALFLALGLLVAAPALAGDLTSVGGATAWHSTQCTKPTSPASLLKAHPETAGDDMNSLVAQHNAYVDAAQNYMNCISSEAAHDQTAVNEQIASGAQTAIADMKGELDADAQALRSRQSK
ncbi:MAG: hypothetical protein WCD70_17045 [Alphaproteobacteria bacterium]